MQLKFLLNYGVIVSCCVFGSSCATNQEPQGAIDSKAEEPAEQVSAKDNSNLGTVYTDEFDAVMAQQGIQNPRNQKDPEQALAESLDGLSQNSFHPSGSSVENAVYIPGHLNLWKRQKTEVRWIRLQYPNHRMVMHSVLSKQAEGKWYDIMSVSDKVGGEILNFYFNVTESFIEKEPNK